MFLARHSNSTMNLWINSAGSLLQMCVGSCLRVSPMLTDMGTCACSNMSVALDSFL